MSKRMILLVVMICILGGLLVRHWQRPTPAPDDSWKSFPAPPRSPYAGANGTLFVPIDTCATVTPEPDYRAYIGYSDLVGPDGSYIEGYKDLIGKIQTWRGVYRPRTIYAGELTPIPPEKITVVFVSKGRC